MTRAMPPSTAIDAMTYRKLIGSWSKRIPPVAASTGTLSWTVAALAAFNPDNAAYQIT